MKLIALCLMLFYATAFSQDRLQPLQTPVRISEFHDRRGYANIFVKVEAASRSSQVLIFLRYRERDGFYLARSIEGDPPLPRTRDHLPSQDDRFRSQYSSTWYMNVKLDQFPERPSEVYVAVVEVNQKYEGSRQSDLGTLQYLPFKGANNFLAVLEMLRDYGWVPTGYTKSAS